MDTATALRQLADRQAITDLIYRDCRSVDRLDIPPGHSIWHEDGYAGYGEGAAGVRAATDVSRAPCPAQ
jgi:SnoaL-like domain